MNRWGIILLLAIGTLAGVELRGSTQGTAPTVRTVRGRVILDLNRNGKLDGNEKGIADVLLTDGMQFVRTESDGSYTIKVADDPLVPHKPAQVIAVRWSSGLWPVGQHWFKRVGDIKPGESVDFFLRSDKQRLPFTLVHATDPHNDLIGSDLFRDEIDRLGSQANLCVFTGDLGYMGRDNAEKSFTSIRAFTRAFPVPLLHTPGNHDICDIHTTKWSEDHPLAGYGPYLKYLGPIRWSFDYADVHLVGLDWARIAEDGKLQTGTPDTAIAYLEQDLKFVKPGTRIFVFMHHHHRLDEKFWDVLVKHKVELLLAGHSHRNLDQSRRGVKALTTMNLRGPYRLLVVNEVGHDIVNRCSGCKDPSYHSKHCQLFRPTGATKRGAGQKIIDKAVDGVVSIQGARAGSFEVTAEIEPATAQKFGMRFAPADPKAKPTEIICFDNDLVAGGLRTSAVRGRDQKTFQLTLIAESGKLCIYANGRAQMERPFDPGEKCGVSLFAERGRAFFKNVEVWDFKAAK